MSLSFELAKKLKDAGFPQKGTNYWVNSAGKNLPNNPDSCYFPTLEELIEACGEEFNGLIRKGETVWLATGGNHIGFYGDDFVKQGSTPSEAVANLWLALNKKDL